MTAPTTSAASISHGPDRVDAHIAERMRAAGQPDVAIRTFLDHVAQLRAGASGKVRESDISPVDTLPDAETFAEYEAAGIAALGQCVVIKLNGGLGTSMGMRGPKSLVEVRPGLSFLDLIARQSVALRGRHGVTVPLVLMNSFRTREPSLHALAAHADLPTLPGVALDFLQHKVPKLLAGSLEPASTADDPHAWCPPGHGDLYTAMLTSGTLAALRQAGVRWAFVSNADNLGAVLDPQILGYVVTHQLPFLMEAADRTETDRKGGHLARAASGGLLLREAAQCPADEVDTFQDWRRHRYFNTNNLWVDLDALDAALQSRDGVMGLPLICNHKHLDPTDPSSPAVVQLETAMGAALEVFPGAAAVRVPRSRFVPVKTTSDLLRLRSDFYRVDAAGRVVQSDPEAAPPVITLDPAHFKLVDDLERRFPEGAPSLARCTRLRVDGDVVFGANVQISGAVAITNNDSVPRMIRADTEFSDADAHA